MLLDIYNGNINEQLKNELCSSTFSSNCVIMFREENFPFANGMRQVGYNPNVDKLFLRFTKDWDVS